MKYDFDENEIRALLEIIDVALRASGLKLLQNCNHFIKKLSEKQHAEVKKPVIEQDKK